jgi:hypothetical protein
MFPKLREVTMGRLGPSKPFADDYQSSGNSFLRTGTNLENDYIIEFNVVIILGDAG